MNAAGSRTSYVPHIDGLRALAVLCVIVYHLSERWLPGGFAGVDVFFVISGFVVSASVAEIRGMRPLALFGYFYARRIRRIVPALVVCLLATSFLSALFIPHAWLSRQNEETGLYAFFGLSNFILATNKDNYFAPQVDFNPYTHTWSLGVEEQFYLLFPPLFALWMAGGKWRRVSLALFSAGLIASLAVAVWLGRTNATLSFYMLASRFWELAAGVVLYQVLASRGHPFSEHDRPATMRERTGTIASAALLAAGFLFSKPSSFPFPGALLPVAGTLGLLAFLHGREPRGLVAAALRHRAVVFVGRISYSLYLWHWPIFVLFRWTFGLASTVTMAAALLVTFGLATASYYLVEQPARRSDRVRRLPRPAVIAAGVLLVASSAWMATKVTENAEWISLSTVTRHADEWYPVRSLNPPVTAGACAAAVRPEATAGGARWVLSRTACAGKAVPMPRIFAIGDSHATAYLPMLQQLAADTGAEVVLYANAGCPYLSLQAGREGEGTSCPHRNNAAVAEILSQGRHGDILFLPSLRLDRFATQYSLQDIAQTWDAMQGPIAMGQRRHVEAEAEAALAPFAAKGMRIVFEAPKPIFPSVPFRCADWFNAGNPICATGRTMPREDIERYRKPVLDSFRTIAAAVPGVSVWDPLPVLCSAEECPTMKAGHPLFFDGDHISGYANRVLLPSFEQYVATLASSTTAAAMTAP